MPYEKGQGRVMTRTGRAALLLLAAVVAASCTTNRAFRRAEQLALAGDWDSAVVYFTKAVQENPDRPEYKILLERAMQSASNGHMDKAKVFEEAGDLENALLEYKKALEFAPSNAQASHRRSELERMLRERAEASRAPAKIDAMRERARRQTEAPTLNPTSKDLISLRLAQGATVQDALNVIGDTTGINIMVEQGAQRLVGQPANVRMEGVTLEQALNLIMTANQLWYKVMNDRTILVIQDTAPKRQQYEDQVIRTFYVSHAEPQELFTLINQVMRIQGVAIQPVATVNKTTNTITVRGTPNIVNIIEKVIQANDRPRAEIVIDVEILEVNRQRVKELGLNLSQYQIGAIFSPEAAPGTGTGDADGDGDPTPATGRADRDVDRDGGHHHVQPEHDLAGDQHRRLLSDGAPGRHQVPRERQPDAADREAPAARRGRHGHRAQSRRRHSRAADHLRRIRGWRPQHRADPELRLSAGRRHREDEPARHVRERDRPGDRGREQHARGQPDRRRPEPADLRQPQGADAHASAGGGVEPAGRPRARGRSARPSRIPGNHEDSDSQGHPRRHRRSDHADRHRDPADAAYRPHARSDAGTPQPDLHRTADQPRIDRTTASDCGATRTGAGTAAARPRPARRSGSSRRDAAGSGATRGWTRTDPGESVAADTCDDDDPRTLARAAHPGGAGADCARDRRGGPGQRRRHPGRSSWWGEARTRCRSP